jgi:hypothetical protein
MSEERERDLAYLQQVLDAERDEKDKESRRKVPFSPSFLPSLLFSLPSFSIFY